MAEHAGNRWYKCDLHLHTMTSKCYLDKENTAEEWVARALERGLDAVAVTDHNDYRGISEIVEEGRKQGLAVFPGVEITCDTSKIHMLIIFDTDRKAENVRDFLIRCDIDSDNFGDPDGTSLSVFEICEIARKRGAMIIASHIDEFNSVNSMNTANQEKLFSGGYIDAVQVTNVPVWRKLKEDKDTEAMQQTLREAYGPDATPQEVDRWRKCFNLAERMGLPMMAFSDNPATPTDSRHGLDGIGSVYTWIQMDDSVDLESIRQSLITPDSRVRTMFDSPEEPRSELDFWIRSVEIRKTALNPHAPVRFDFHPQMNCIIGGKGSGKSALVQVLSGAGRHLYGSLLSGLLEKENSFYTLESESPRGIFRKDSEIEIMYCLFGTNYRMLITDIENMEHQKTRLFRLDGEKEEEVPLELLEMLRPASFREKVYLQKQINGIISTPGAVMDMVDRSIDGMLLEKAKRDYYLEQLINISASLQSTATYLLSQEITQKEADWLDKLISSEDLPEHLQEKLSRALTAREDTLKRQQIVHEEAQTLLEQWKTIQKRYEDCLEEIRRMRREHVAQVLEDDPNYKIELEPMASRKSFHLMRQKLLPGDEELMAEDIRKLEDALFSPKKGLEEYTRLLLSVRAQSLLPEESVKKLIEEGLGSTPEEERKKDEDPEKYLNVFSPYFSHLIGRLSENDFERILHFHPEDELRLFYHPKGVKKFYPMTTASSGERATAVLTFVLAASNAPLIIDQPEDDLDNRVVYEEIIPKLKLAKQKRQLIIVTHNSNITVNADAEMVIVMDSKSKFVRIKEKGSVDSGNIRSEICDIMEGTEEGFHRRAQKYHIE